VTYQEFLTALRELVQSGKTSFHVGDGDDPELIRDEDGRCPVCSVGWHSKGVDERSWAGYVGSVLGMPNSDVQRVVAAADFGDNALRRELEEACGLGGDG